MSNKQKVTVRWSKSNPCPVCRTGTKGCSLTADEQYFCRAPQPVRASEWVCLTRQPDANGFQHYRRADDDRHKRYRHAKAYIGNGAAPKKPRTLDEYAREFNAGLTPDAWDRAVENLGFPHLPHPQTPKTRPVIGMGFTKYGCMDETASKAEQWVPALTFCLADGTEHLCGIAKRFLRPVSVNGGEPTNKLTMRGSKAGLYLGRDWRTRPGPVFVVEGGSDTFALSVCGLAVVGRPSNTGGLEHLAELFRGIDPDRPIIILGENDARPHPLNDEELWPGKEGVGLIAGGLTKALGRPILTAYPPGPSGGDAAVKDWRDWVTELLAGQGEGLDLDAVAAVVREHVERAAMPVQPTDALLDEPKAGPPFQFIPSDVFAGGDYRPEWFVPKVLVRRQPGVIGGPSKGMKTSILVDMCVSLAAGKPFLGRFDIPRPARVAVVSGESGEHTLQETARRVCDAREVNLADLGDRLQWCFTLPRFPDEDNMAVFARTLLGFNAELVVIDPTYLCMGEIDAKNLFEMGQAFRVVADVLLKAGVTPILAHHANRMMKVGTPMELTDLAYSGLEQFTRQFILINRVVPYQSDGEHKLWVRIGGSAGHGGLWALHISEGVTDEDFKGRQWEVTVATADEAKQQRDAAKEEAKRREKRELETKVLTAIDKENEKGQPAATLTRLATATGLDFRKLKPVIAQLEEDGLIEPHEFTKRTGKGKKTESKCDGYRRVSTDEPDLTAATEDRLHRVAEEQKGGSVLEEFDR